VNGAIVGSHVGDGGGCFYLDVRQKELVCVWRIWHSGLELPEELPMGRVPFRLNVHPRIVVVIRGRILGGIIVGVKIAPEL
jgi:hypothetical protein